jgi:hypothetical protein
MIDVSHVKKDTMVDMETGISHVGVNLLVKEHHQQIWAMINNSK